MKKKQFLALALSAVMAGGMLAGCGSSNGSSSSSKSDAKDEVVTLKWIQVGEQDIEILAGVCDNASSVIPVTPRNDFHVYINADFLLQIWVDLCKPLIIILRHSVTLLR